MSTPDQHDEIEADGGEPTEEVGPDECAPGAERCGFNCGQLKGGPEEGFTAMDELHEAFTPEPYKAIIDPEDGIARPVDPPGGMPTDPPFTYRHLVCIADDRKFVEKFREEVDQAADKDDLTRALRCTRSLHQPRVMSGPVVVDLRSKYDEDTGRQRVRKTFLKGDVVNFFGMDFGHTDSGTIVPVRPRRPKCVHYKRQLFNVDGMDCEKPGSKHQFANCTARRSNGCAYMSLNQQAVFACDYRDPPDDASCAKYMDSFDQKRLRDKAHLTIIPMLGFSGDEIRLEDKGEDDDDD